MGVILMAAAAAICKLVPRWPRVAVFALKKPKAVESSASTTAPTRVVCWPSCAGAAALPARTLVQSPLGADLRWSRSIPRSHEPSPARSDAPTPEIPGSSSVNGAIPRARVTDPLRAKPTRPTYRSDLPRGSNAIGINLMCCRAKGIPMIVMANTIALPR